MAFSEDRPRTGAGHSTERRCTVGRTSNARTQFFAVLTARDRISRARAYKRPGFSPLQLMAEQYPQDARNLRDRETLVVFRRSRPRLSGSQSARQGSRLEQRRANLRGSRFAVRLGDQGQPSRAAGRSFLIPAHPLRVRVRHREDRFRDGCTRRARPRIVRSRRRGADITRRPASERTGHASRCTRPSTRSFAVQLLPSWTGTQRGGYPVRGRSTPVSPSWARKEARRRIATPR